jgi:alcohol dehydrogenase YqhD (iron-dependent ADH family)
MNPSLTLSLPAWQTFAGITDMCVHIFERLFSQTGDVPVSDGISFSLLRSIRSAALVLLHDPSNYDARSTIMWASTLAHDGLCGVGRDEDWASHGMEHELSAAKPAVTHGAGLAVIVPAWMRYVYRERPERFAQLGREVFGISATGSTKEDALAAIDAVQDFFCTIGMPRYLNEFGFTRDDVDGLLPTLRMNKGDSFGSFKKISIEDARSIYLSAFKPEA